MGKKAISLVAALALCLAAGLAGCGGKSGGGAVDSKADLATKVSTVIKAANPEKNPELAKKRKDTLVYGTSNSNGVFLDIYTDSVYDSELSYPIFETLCDFDPTGKAIPNVAERWDIAPDGKEYTFYLRKDVRFADGHPLTAEDVAFIYYVQCDKSFDGPADIFRFNLKGAKAYRDGTAATIEGIQIVDPYTIRFVLDKPSARFLDYIGGESFIYPKHYYGKDYKQGDCSGVKALIRKPLGSGPYKLAEFREGVEVIYTVNENYWGPKPSISRIIYKVVNPNVRMQMVAAGEIDIAQISPTNARNINQLKGFGFVDIHQYPQRGYSYIGMNQGNPIFQDKRVRQAMTYGLNRKQIVEAFTEGFGIVASQPQSKASPYYNPDVNPYDFDPEKAARLLAEAGWQKGPDGVLVKDGKRFEIRFSATAPSELNEILIPVAKKNYEKLGIVFIPEQMEFNAVKQKVDSRQADTWMMGWSLGNDPDSVIFNSDGVQNRIGYKNERVDELFLKGRAMIRREDRIPVYQEIYKLINEDCPYVFLLQNTVTVAVNSRVSGVETSPFRNFLASDLGKLKLQ